MAIYFVDYENVGSTGIEGIDLLSADNTVHIFYSVKADTMKMDQVIQLMKVKAEVAFHDVTMRGQKNALDFQLIAMLYFTKKDDDTCYIISKDQGYDAAIVFGRTIGAEQVYRRVSLNSENISDTKVPQQPRRSGRRSEPARSSGHMSQQPQPVLLAEKARGVTALPQTKDNQNTPAAKPQTENKEFGRKDNAKSEYVKKEMPKPAEPARKEEVKAAEPVRKEEVKAAAQAVKEEVKAAEPAKKEEMRAAEPARKEEVRAAEPAKKEDVKAAEPAAKVWPKPYDPSKDTLKSTGIPSFRREVVVVKTVENAGKGAAVAKTAEKPAEPAAKTEEKAVQTPAPSAVKAAEKPAVKKEEKPAAMKAEEKPAAVKAEDKSAAVKAEEKPAVVKAEEKSAAKPAEALALKAEAQPAAESEAEEAYNPLKAAMQWDILQSSFGGLFDLDIPEEFLMDDDEEIPAAEEKAKAAEQTVEEKASAEPAKEKKEEGKQSRNRSRQSRRRNQRQANAQKADAEEKAGAQTPAAYAAEKAEEPAKTEAKAEQPVKTEAKAEQPTKSEKKAEQPAKSEKKAEQPAKSEAKAEQKKNKEQQKAKDAKEAKVIDKKTQAQALVRVKEVMQAAGFDLEVGDYALITDALLSTSTKNQFYQFFRKTKGEAAGREFYLKIRGQYENLKVLREA